MNYPEKSLIFRIWIKTSLSTSPGSKNRKKGVQNGLKPESGPRFSTFGVLNGGPSSRAFGLS